MFACAGKTEPPSRLILSQTSAGKSHHLATSSRAPHFPGSVAVGVEWESSGLVRCLIHLPRLEGPATGQDAPGDAREFVGKGYRQHVVMQPLPGRLDPGLEPVALPDLRLDQHDPRRLHEQNPQVTIATPGYLAEDGTVAGRYLFWNEPQPGGKVATLREHIPGADRGHHRAGDHRPNPGHATLRGGSNRPSSSDFIFDPSRSAI